MGLLRITKKQPKRLRLGGPPRVSIHVPMPAVKSPRESLVGKGVTFLLDGVKVAGKALREDGDELIVDLAVPDSKGVLSLTGTEHRVKIASATADASMAISDRRAKFFELTAEAKVAEDTKAVPVYAAGDDKTPVDYRDVVIEGFASTFSHVTPMDRGGDIMAGNAFDETLAEFMRNPVMLLDHNQSVESLAGSWTKVGVVRDGLAVRGAISNAPGLRDTRFKIVEKHLKGLSIGGIWHYGHDGRTIEHADLFEISLVVIPMNPDALMGPRDVKAAECRKAFERLWNTKAAKR